MRKQYGNPDSYPFIFYVKTSLQLGGLLCEKCPPKALRSSLKKVTKHVNRDSHIASSTISQSSLFDKVCCSLLASSQRKLHGYIEVLKFDITIETILTLFTYFVCDEKVKIKKFKLV